MYNLEVSGVYSSQQDASNQEPLPIWEPHTRHLLHHSLAFSYTKVKNILAIASRFFTNTSITNWSARLYKRKPDFSAWTRLTLRVENDRLAPVSRAHLCTVFTGSRLHTDHGGVCTALFGCGASDTSVTEVVPSCAQQKTKL